MNELFITLAKITAICMIGAPTMIIILGGLRLAAREILKSIFSIKS